MADIYTDDLFLVNRGSKSGNATFSMIKASVLSGKLHVGNDTTTDLKPEDIQDGMIWVNTSGENEILIYSATDSRWKPLDVGSSVEVGEITKPESNVGFFKEGDLFYDQPTDSLYIKNDSGASEWTLIAPDSIGSLTNVSAAADNASEGEFLEAELNADGDIEYVPSGRRVPQVLSDLEDVFTDSYPPKNGDSLVFFDDVSEGVAGVGNEVPGWKPSEVKSSGGRAPKLLVNLSEQSPNRSATGTPRFTDQKFNVDFKVPPGGEVYEYGNYKLKGYVDGEFNTTPPVTEAEMGGLRFHYKRKTHLVGPAGAAPTKLTASVWIKPTKFKNYFSVLALKGQNDSPIIAANDGSYVYVVNNGNVLTPMDGGGAKLTLNTWQHVVIQLEQGKTAKLYVNGALKPSDAGLMDFTGSGGYIIGHTQGTLDSGHDQQIPNGYLSDFYVVENQILEPSAFGRNYPDPGGEWGPIDSKEVLSNISDFGPNGFYLPFDPTAQGFVGQKWSDMVSGPPQGYAAGEELVKAFDGNFDTYCNASSAGGTATFTPNFGTGTFDVTMRAGNAQLASATTIDGVLGTGETVAGVGEYIHWTGLTSFNQMSIPTDGLTGGARVSFYSITVNGHELIDNVSYSGIGNDASGNGNNFQDKNFNTQELKANTSQVWSSGSVSSINGWNVGQVPQSFFDGNYDTACAVGAGTGTITHNFGSAVTVANSVSVLMNHDVDGTLSVNDGPAMSFPSEFGQARWITIPFTGNLTKITVFGSSGNAGHRAVKVDDTVLVDTGVTPPLSSFGTVDTVIDTPSEDYAVTNPTGETVVTNGGLDVVGIRSTWGLAPGTIGTSTGKIYAEYTLTKGDVPPNVQIGIALFNSMVITGNQPMVDKDWGWGVVTQPAGLTIRHKWTNLGEESYTLAPGTNWKVNDVVGVALDVDTGDFYVYLNGILLGNTNDYWVDKPPAGQKYTFAVSLQDTESVMINYGQQPFVHTPPAGYEGLYKPFIFDSTRSFSTDRLYLKFDNTGAITGLADEAEYVTMNSDESANNDSHVLTFPDVFSDGTGNGQTPDDTLASGTAITVEALYDTDEPAEGKKTESNPVTPLDPAEPEPDPDVEVQMSGLRFDADRDTYLNRSGTTPTATFTTSFWIKRTGTNNARVFKIEGAKDNNKLLCVWAFGDGSLKVNNNSSTLLQVNNALPSNEWVHVVVNRNDTSIEAYVNGTKSTASNTQTFGTGTYQYNVGGFGDNSDLNGYLSDVFFVEAQALSADTFGYTHTDGRWTPKDNSVILPAIKAKTAPYDERPNMDEKWSAGSSTGTLSGPWSNAFNGDPTTYAVATAESVLTLDTPIDISGKTVETLASASNGEVVKINGITITTGSTNINSSKYVDNTAELSGETQINTISIGGSSYVAFKSIKLDGQELVDGPADNSQNWSSSKITYSGVNAGPFSGQPVTAAFDGKTSGVQDGANAGRGAFWAAQSKGTEFIEFNPQIPTGTGVRVFVQSVGLGGDFGNFEINGVLHTPATEQDWYDASLANTTLNSIQIDATSTAGAQIWAVEVDGKILVDSGAQWDTSQVWSDLAVAGSTIFPNEGFDRLFDGDFATWLAPLNQNGKFVEVDFTGQNLTYSKLEMVLGHSLAPNGAVEINGQDVTANLIDAPQPPSAGKLYDVTNWITGDKELQSLRIQNNGGGSNYVAYAIIVDGKILVDPGNFGNNGFYLPFDPAAADGDYRSQLVADNITNIQNAFNPSTTAEATYTGNLRWTPTGGYPFTNKVQATFNAHDGVTVQVKLVGQSEQAVTTDGTSSISLRDIYTGSGTLEYINFNAPGPKAFKSVTIDGVELINHSSIGNDASGNGNHFQDENFSTVTGNTSEVWSGKLTLNRSEWNSTTNYNNKIGPTINAFDGTTTVFAGQKDGAGGENIATLTPDNNFTSVTSLRVYVRTSPSIDNSVQVYVNGDTSSKQTVTFKGDGWFAYSSPPATISEINISSISGTAIRVAAFEINNEILTQPITLDTVLDTPIKDYAVLEGSADITNGGLEWSSKGLASTSRNSTISSTSKFYYESVVMDDSDMFGITQIPATNGAHPGENSTSVGLHVSAGVYFNSSSTGYDFTLAAGDIIGVAYDGDANQVTWYKNGVAGSPVDVSLSGPIAACIRPYGPTPSPFNFGQQPFAYTPPAGYEGLYTEYGLPAGRLTKSMFDGVQNAIQQFHVDVAARKVTLETAKQSARTKLLALGLTADEVTALSVDL